MEKLDVFPFPKFSAFSLFLNANKFALFRPSQRPRQRAALQEDCGQTGRQQTLALILAVAALSRDTPDNALPKIKDVLARTTYFNKHYK